MAKFSLSNVCALAWYVRYSSYRQTAASKNIYDKIASLFTTAVFVVVVVVVVLVIIISYRGWVKKGDHLLKFVTIASDDVGKRLIYSL